MDFLLYILCFFLFFVQINILYTDPKTVRMILLSPYDIRYTQRSISCNWGHSTPHRNTQIDDTLDALDNGEIFPCDIDPIRVVLHDEEYYSLDNRRLWVFKNFGEEIYCELCQGPLPKGRGYYGKNIKVRRRYCNRGYGSYQCRSNASRSTRKMWNKFTNNRRHSGNHKKY